MKNLASFIAGIVRTIVTLLVSVLLTTHALVILHGICLSILVMEVLKPTHKVTARQESTGREACALHARRESTRPLAAALLVPIVPLANI